MEQNGNGVSRRSETPEHAASRRDGGRRSRNRLRSEMQESRRGRTHYRSRNSSRHSRRSRSIREKERKLERERDRVRRLEDEIDRERSRRRSGSSPRGCRRDVNTDGAASSRQVDQQPSGVDARMKRRYHYEQDDLVPARRLFRRSGSPAFSAKDVADILNSIKPSQPSAAAQGRSLNSDNILPDFDPSSKNQRIDIWLRKVNECAAVYGWDDKTVVHFAMQKLQGLAKTWYEGLNSILFSWSEWQEKLLTAFPCEENFGQSLEDMLRRKSENNEPIEVYFYEKIALLNRCDIVGKRAVDCVIHGLSDKTLKTSALALRCTHPDQLLQFLMSNRDLAQTVSPQDCTNCMSSFAHVTEPSTQNNVDGKKAVNPNLFCFNCKEQGHPFMKCPKPLIKCQICQRFGHKSDSCKFNLENENGTNNKTV